MFKYKHQSELGIASNTVNIYRGKRLIGYIEAKYLSAFKNGNYKNFKPVPNWRNTFSQSLKIELGLIKGNPHGGKMARQTSSKTTTKRAKKKAVRRIAKKKTTRRISKKTAVKRNPIRTRYYIKTGPKYFNGAGFSDTVSRACFFDSLNQASNIAHQLASATKKQITVHSNKPVKKK